MKLQLRACHAVLLTAFIVTGVLSGWVAGTFFQPAANSAISSLPTARAASDRVDGFITCTCPVDNSAGEAVFVLDSTTGLLSGRVLSKIANSGFQATFQGNVNMDLQRIVNGLNAGVGKKARTSRSSSKKPARVLIEMPQEPKYIMTSGTEAIVGRTTDIRPSVGALYITEVNTGILLVYVLPWNQSLFSANAPYVSKLQCYAFDRVIVPMVMEESVEEE